MKNGVRVLIGLCAVSFSARAQFFPIPAGAVPFGNDRRAVTASVADFQFSDANKQLLVGLTANVNAPAYSFPGTGNSDNGMWRSGTDEISLVTAGVNRITIGPTGSITFGTSVTPFVIRTGDTMTGGLTVLAGVTANAVRSNFFGILTGSVLGNVTGNVVGSVTGNVTGSSSLNVLKAGDTMSGNLTISSSSNPTLVIEGVTGTSRIINFNSVVAGASTRRFAMSVNGVNESGSSAGSNWALNRYDNSGGFLATPISISRDGTGIAFGDPVTMGAVTATGLVNAGGFRSGLGGITVTGTVGINGSSSGTIRISAPAAAGGAAYTLPSAAPTASNSYLVGITTGAMVWEPIPQSEIFLQGATAYGSTATKVRRWITTVTNTGSAVTLTQSATNGDTLTVNETGAYGISYCDNFNAASNMGISINASGTTSVQSLPPSQVACGNVSASVDIGACCSAIIAVSSGSVVRAHTDGTLNGSNLWMQSIRIRKIGP